MDGSHWINMRALLVELRGRGHEVTVLRSSSSLYIAEEPGLFHSITVPAAGKSGILEDSEMVSRFVQEMLEIHRGGPTWTAFVRNAQAVGEMLRVTHIQQRALIRRLFEDPRLMARLGGAGFQLVLTDPFFPTGVMLAHHLQLPVVCNSRWLSTGNSHALLAPSPPSYVPVVGSRFGARMSFLQRLSNVVHYLTSVKLAGSLVHPEYDELCRRYLGPGASVEGLIRRADLWLMRTDFVFDFPRPTMPNVVYVGGFQCRPPRPLPAELEDFMRSSGPHGVVFMSLGTLVSSLPAYLVQSFAEAFARLPQKVLWRHIGERPANLGNNTLLAGWVPQNDVLGHPKTRAFVSHGGTNGIFEAIYHGVPVLGLPLIFDQFDNLVRLESRGAAKVLDPTRLDAGQLLEGLHEVLGQPSYRRGMQRLSGLHRDQPQTPMERAVFWIEFVLRHGGAAHLRAASADLPWYAYHSLDVAGFAALVGATLAAPALWALRKLYRALRGTKAKQS
ncbi:UDP-glucuronosyltransferase 2A1-like [Carcharodon carcharias]|uniref:UDP-glucuronosyltransferase 2A1-like n=1 Tax=Carcharodon carcharias TaxID=13397 RepID=UPI001B7E8001|nr:UDP-glucuronosyltransferase 2A1-like [Carcharodon carcharias]